jgi:nitrate/nitrite transporter NarK
MSTVRRWVIMVVLGLSGGIIFLLPFLREVYYEPMMDAFGLNNTEAGFLMAVFGFFSMISYFPGGWLADRVSPRKLISLALFGTGVLGLYFSTFPGYMANLVIHACWGIAMSLLFWGAMIRVTRGWAPPEQQGQAFGILETTRGVGEIGASSALLAIFAWLGSGDKALSVVVIQLSSIVLLLAVLSWFTIEDTTKVDTNREKIGLDDVVVVLKMPIVWLTSIVVMTAYSAYWTSFFFTPYVTNVFLMSATIGAAVGVGKMWLKPIAALIAGFAGDHYGIARSTITLFVILIISFAVFAITPASPGLFILMLVNVAIAAIAIFALRGIYFALLEEGGVPLAVTGTAGGVVSAIGFTPDVFMPMIGGVLLDNYPGATGYQYLYLSTAGMCVVGLIAATVIYKRYVR